MRRTTILVASMACLVALGVGSALRADEPGIEGRVGALEREVLALKARLDKLEGARGQPRPGSRVATMEDLNSLRQLAGHAVIAAKAPIKDGALDPYSFVREGNITGANLGLFRSARQGRGPTDEEIRRGDYTNFPWERYRGDGSDLRRPKLVPILWEKEPGADGKHVVAFNDGSTKLVEPAELESLLKK